jgi:hypothetical protein
MKSEKPLIPAVTTIGEVSGGLEPVFSNHYIRRVRTEDNYYVYFYDTKSGFWIYERTTGTKWSAEQRVEHLKKFYSDAKYLLNETIKGALY